MGAWQEEEGVRRGKPWMPPGAHHPLAQNLPVHADVRGVYTDPHRVNRLRETGSTKPVL